MQTTYDYDDDGKQVMQQTVESHNASFLPCVGESCGAWQNGLCKYATSDR